MAELARTIKLIDGIPARRFVLRLSWVALRLVLVLYLGQKGVRFFYQGF
jgi:hypothetical protein